MVMKITGTTNFTHFIEGIECLNGEGIRRRDRKRWGELIEATEG